MLQMFLDSVVGTRWTWSCRKEYCSCCRCCCSWAPNVILTTKSRQYLVVWLKYGWSWIWTVFCRQKVVVNGWLFFNCFLTVFCLLNVGASKNQIEKSMWSTVIVKLFRGATSIICVSLDVKLLCTKISSRDAALKIESPSPLVKETKLRH